MSADGNTHADFTDPQTAIKALIERIERHESDGEDIRLAADKLGLDAKRIKTIRKAKADAAASQRTLEALFAGDLVPAGTGDELAPDVSRKPRAPKAEAEDGQ